MYFKSEKDYEPYKKVIVPKGKENKNIAIRLQEFCKMTVKELAKETVKILQEYEYKIRIGKDYLFAIPNEKKQENNIILTAHIDTVQDKNGAGKIYVDKKDNKTYLWSPKGIGGDDRCGVTIIFDLLEKGYRPTILLCDKEECGGKGSEEFAETQTKKNPYFCIIELDRQGSEDLVFYDEDNEEWQEWLEKETGYKKTYGSFSDIVNLYDMGIASVNISVGYYHQHTKDEYIVYEEMMNTEKIVEKLLKNIYKKFKHKERYVNWKNDYLYDYEYYNNYFRKDIEEMEWKEYEVVFKDLDGQVRDEILYATNKADLYDKIYKLGYTDDEIISINEVVKQNELKKII